MKKGSILLSIVLLLVTVLSLTGCNGKTEITSEEDSLPVITVSDAQPTNASQLDPDPTKQESQPETTTEEVSETESVSTTAELPETESVATTAVIPETERNARIKAFHVVPGAYNTIDYEDACRLSLNDGLKEVGCIPVFRVDSVEEYDLLSKLLPNDVEIEGDEHTILEQQSSTFNKGFFMDNTLFAVLYLGESTCFSEEHFQMDGVISNQNLHLRVTFSYPKDKGKDFLCRCYWLFVTIPKSEVDSLIAYDVTKSERELPKDWSEAVNPDWRKQGIIEKVDDSTEAETEPLMTQEPETTVVERSFHMVQTTYAVYDAARQKGLNEKLESAGSSPVFRLNSTADVSLFCALFKNDTELVPGIAPYNQEFFKDHVLFVIYMETGSSSNTEERFQVDKLIQNKVLHLRVSCTYPGGFIKADKVCSWFFVPMDRGTADSLIAFDATWTNDSLPPDWTEAVNPDWRTN